MKRCIVPVNFDALHSLLQMPDRARITGCEYDTMYGRILLFVQGMGFEPTPGEPIPYITPTIHRTTIGTVDADIIKWESES